MTNSRLQTAQNDWWSGRSVSLWKYWQRLKKQNEILTTVHKSRAFSDTDEIWFHSDWYQQHYVTVFHNFQDSAECIKQSNNYNVYLHKNNENAGVKHYIKHTLPVLQWLICTNISLGCFSVTTQLQKYSRMISSIKTLSVVLEKNMFYTLTQASTGLYQTVMYNLPFTSNAFTLW